MGNASTKNVWLGQYQGFDKILYEVFQMVFRLYRLHSLKSLVERNFKGD
jgi:hypothetical protein